MQEASALLEAIRLQQAQLVAETQALRLEREAHHRQMEEERNQRRPAPSAQQAMSVDTKAGPSHSAAPPLNRGEPDPLACQPAWVAAVKTEPVPKQEQKAETKVEHNPALSQLRAQLARDEPASREPPMDPKLLWSPYRPDTPPPSGSESSGAQPAPLTS